MNHPVLILHNVTIKQTLSHLLLGKRGGVNRVQIIELLKERPYNLNQLAKELDLNYRTVKHHIDNLIEYDILYSSRTGKYGNVYFLTPEMEQNLEVFEDIQQKMALVRSSPRFFQSVIEQTTDAIIFIDDEGKAIFCNRAAENLFGFEEQDILGNSIAIFPHTEELARMMGLIAAGKHIATFETKGRHSSGREIDISLTLDPIKQEDGTLLGYAVFARDNSAFKLVEQELIEYARRYQMLAKLSSIAITLTDLEGRIIYASPQTCELHGLDSQREILGREALSLIALEHHEKAIENVRAILEEGTVTGTRLTFLRRDGTSFQGDMDGALLRNAHQDPRGFLFTTRVVSGGEETSDLDVDDLTKYSLVFRNAPVAMVLLTTEGIIQETNPAFLRLLGATDKRLLKKSLTDLIHAKDRDPVSQGLETCPAVTGHHFPGIRIHGKKRKLVRVDLKMSALSELSDHERLILCVMVPSKKIGK